MVMVARCIEGSSIKLNIYVRHNIKANGLSLFKIEKFTKCSIGRNCDVCVFFC